MLISDAKFGSSTSATTMPTSCAPLPESTGADQATETAGAKTGRQRYSPRHAFGTQRGNKYSLERTPESHTISSRNAYTNFSDNVQIRLERGLSCHETCERPTVVAEQDEYWVVSKPPGRLLWNKKERSANSVDGSYEPACAETLASFLQDQHPEEYYPLLSSRQHNFGVIFHLENFWVGLNIVAKSEAAYSSFQRLLELQLIHSYVECFVMGPPLRSASELFGTASTGKDTLCIKVLQSTVCRTAGYEETSHCTGNSVSACVASVVVSHAIFQISFPPVLLPDVLRCNGLVITTSPYARNTGEEPGECYGSLCCFALSFPQVKLRASRHILGDELGGKYFTGHCEGEKTHTQAFSLSERLSPASNSLQSSSWLWIWAGLFTASPIVFYDLLPKILAWLQNVQFSHSKASVQHAFPIISGFVNSISKIRRLLENSRFFVWNDFTPWRQKLHDAYAEILFGQAEGKPWLETLQ